MDFVVGNEPFRGKSRTLENPAPSASLSLRSPRPLPDVRARGEGRGRAFLPSTAQWIRTHRTPQPLRTSAAAGAAGAERGADERSRVTRGGVHGRQGGRERFAGDRRRCDRREAVRNPMRTATRRGNATRQRNSARGADAARLPAVFGAARVSAPACTVAESDGGSDNDDDSDDGSNDDSGGRRLATSAANP